MLWISNTANTEDAIQLITLLFIVIFRKNKKNEIEDIKTNGLLYANEYWTINSYPKNFNELIANKVSKELEKMYIKK